jgi:hypothetical protein
VQTVVCHFSTTDGTVQSLTYRDNFFLDIKEIYFEIYTCCEDEDEDRFDVSQEKYCESNFPIVICLKFLLGVIPKQFIREKVHEKKPRLL